MDGIEIYPLISFLIFFVFFVGLTLYVIGMRKAHVAEMSNLPLQEDATATESQPNKPE